VGQDLTTLKEYQWATWLLVLECDQETSYRRINKEGNRKTIPKLQDNVTLCVVDIDDEIQEIEHQLSTDNCETTDNEDKPEGTDTID
jgi:hypothetical protein